MRRQGNKHISGSELEIVSTLKKKHMPHLIFDDFFLRYLLKVIVAVGKDWFNKHKVPFQQQQWEKKTGKLVHPKISTDFQLFWFSFPFPSDQMRPYKNAIILSEKRKRNSVSFAYVHDKT